MQNVLGSVLILRFMIATTLKVCRTFSVVDAQQGRDNRSYSVRVCNPWGCVTSDEADVTVINSAPRIVNQPANVVVAVSNTASLSFVARGSVPLSYFWYFKDALRTNVFLTNTTTAQLQIANARTANQGTYYVVVTNLYGTTKTRDFILTVQTIAPSIASRPVDTDVIAGKAATFSVAATGSAPFTYQWFFNTNTAITGATNASLVITNAQASNVGSYRVVVANLIGRATSAPAALTIQASAPFIETQPVSTNLFIGDRVTFSAPGFGSDPRVYQWFFNSNPIAGATNSFLTRTDLQLTNAGSYRVSISNIYGSVISSSAVLSVGNSPPVITSGPTPADLEVEVGDTASIGVTVAGTKPLTIQWYQLIVDSTLTVVSTNAVPGGTNATLTFTNVEPEHEGLYRVIVTNALGSDTSERITDVILNVRGFGNIIP